MSAIQANEGAYRRRHPTSHYAARPRSPGAAGYPSAGAVRLGHGSRPVEDDGRVLRNSGESRLWATRKNEGVREVQHQHLDYYLDKFTFRFNRRKSKARGLLFHRLAQQALSVGPVPLNHPLMFFCVISI